MTTIVFDGTMLAGDTRGTRSMSGGNNCPSCASGLDSVHTTCNKVYLGHADTMFRGERVIAWGGAGAEPAIAGMSLAIRENMDLETVVKASYRINGGSENNHHMSCTILLVTVAKVYVITKGKMTVKVEEKTEFPVGIGSGESVARFAMRYFGLTAFGGVAAAMRTDKATGGNIEYVVCRDTEDRYKIVKETFTEEEFETLVREQRKEMCNE